MYNLRGVDPEGFLGKLGAQRWMWWLLPIGGALVGEFAATGTIRILTPHRRWRTQRKKITGATIGGLVGTAAAIAMAAASKAPEAGGSIPPAGSDIPPEFYEPGPEREESF